ncbi:hypothetical protein D3C81_1873620 [compost metagenome]
MRILLHKQHGCAGSVHFFDDFKNILHQKRGKPHGRFIQQQQLGVSHKRTAHGKHLLLAAG